MAIEKACHDFPWSENTMKSCLSGRYFNGAVYQQDTLAGFYVGEVAGPDHTLMDICVAPAYQGQGLAKALLSDFMMASEQAGAENLFLEVRKSNITAIGLYLWAGFCEVGIRKDYYPCVNGKEDAVLMAKTLNFGSENSFQY
ncbi:ribosomal protein S18-alanine N-acetyltransferase [Pseudoalteromonas sp. JBTF-M23]|uniref:[Ribosomal protein bS18]-alanine N-acetyltransferase n=1 Tax=Pseudoalteromonas caenipelagi TaxID=2726988 RepID=A0A849VIS1_9GAMM|nr:ribosomal protein S18-alanine N-acetyltransferase [Pseudoalteromonas caenipelagi]NOU51547.1 ribosomal protein S18-alanine N-acetyltransferase [Pseudoalteromonas caenipelagi]